MKFSALVLGFASLMGAMAQTATFVNNTQSTFTLQVGGRNLAVNNNGGLVAVNTGSGTIIQLVGGSLTINQNIYYCQPGGTPRKRQVAGQVVALNFLAAAPAGSFSTVFAISSTSVLSLTNNGVNYAFGLTTTNILVAYVAGTVPAGITAVTVTAVTVGAAATVTTTAAATTVTSTVNTINNVNVNVAVAVTVVVAPLTAPVIASSLYAIPINGIIYYVAQSSTLTSLSTFTSIGGVVITSGTAVVIVSVVPIVVPAVQVVVVSGVTTTLVGAITTLATVTTIQAAGAATTTVLTIRASSTVIATSTVAVTAGAAVVTVTGASAAAGTVAASGSTTVTTSGLPVVSRVSGAGKLGMSAAAIAAVAMALAL